MQSFKNPATDGNDELNRRNKAEFPKLKTKIRNYDGMILTVNL